MEIDFIILFKKYKRFILSVVLIAAGIAVIAAFTVSQLYKVEVKIYSNGFNNPRIIYESVKTQEILDAVINNVGLISVFGARDWDSARERLLSILETVFDSRNNVIYLKIRWENAEQATAIADAFVKELQSMAEISIAKSNISIMQVLSKTQPTKEKMSIYRINIIIFTILISLIIALFLAFIAEVFVIGDKIKSFFLFRDLKEER